jgi:hypothetical protein
MSSVAHHLDISQLPSLKEGMTAEEEATIRKQTCRFIAEVGSPRVLKLPQTAVATAMVFFHQFYAKHSFQKHDRFQVTVAAILLAGKTEESPRKLNTVIMECHKLKNRKSPASLDPKGEEFSKLKERVMSLERVILHTTGFELSVNHPFMFLVEQIQKLIQTKQLRYTTPPQPPAPSEKTSSSNNPKTDKMSTELVQHSMGFANDSMYTCLCLQFSPQVIATACVYLACQFSKVEPSSGGGGNWRKILGDPDMEHLASICLQIMDVKASADSDETFQKIRTQLETIKSREEAGRKSPMPPPSSNPANKRKRV